MHISFVLAESMRLTAVLMHSSRVLINIGNFSCTWTLQNLVYLRNGLLQYLWGTDIDFGDYHHDWHIQRQCNSEMFPRSCKSTSLFPKASRSFVLLAHSNDPVICSDHQKCVVWDCYLAIQILLSADIFHDRRDR